MMKRILIIIHDMRIGGAQKSLLSFLQELSATGGTAEYDVHVMPLKPVGEFLSQIPADIHVDEPSNVLRWMSTRMGPELLRHFSLRGLLGELLWMLRKMLGCLPKELNVAQQVWYNWCGLIPAQHEHWDAAVAYLEGASSYFVIDRVHADKKVIWLHSDYQKQGFYPPFDEVYYHACDAVITVSEKCREAVCNELPKYSDKVHVLENISSYHTVLGRSREGRSIEFEEEQGMKLLTVARLHEQKGVDLAVRAAKCLKESGEKFLWLVVGEGSERSRLEAMIDEFGLQDCFRLIGSRENPYVYMRECDILVQPSRIEGKSIVLDEAKMLCKPIVATNYPTVSDSLIHGETGWIVPMDAQGICDGVKRLMDDGNMRVHMAENLSRLPKGNEEELKRYVDLMF